MNRKKSSIQTLGIYICCNLCLPLISIFKQFLLVIEELLKIVIVEVIRHNQSNNLPPGSEESKPHEFQLQIQNLGLLQWHLQGKLLGRTHNICTLSYRCHICNSQQVTFRNNSQILQRSISLNMTPTSQLLNRSISLNILLSCIPCCSTASILSLFCFNSNGLGRAYLQTYLRFTTQTSRSMRNPRTTENGRMQ